MCRIFLVALVAAHMACAADLRDLLQNAAAADVASPALVDFIKSKPVEDTSPILCELSAQSNTLAKYFLATFYRDGRGVARSNSATYVNIAQMCVKEGCGYAAFDLGRWYALQIPVNWRGAALYFSLAAAQTNSYYSSLGAYDYQLTLQSIEENRERARDINDIHSEVLMTASPSEQLQMQASALRASRGYLPLSTFGYLEFPHVRAEDFLEQTDGLEDYVRKTVNEFRFELPTALIFTDPTEFLYQQQQKLQASNRIFMAAQKVAADKFQSSSNSLVFEMRSASNGVGSFQFSLAMRFQKGDGVPADQTLAQHWFKSALTNGAESARSFIHDDPH